MQWESCLHTAGHCVQVVCMLESGNFKSILAHTNMPHSSEIQNIICINHSALVSEKNKTKKKTSAA